MTREFVLDAFQHINLHFRSPYTAEEMEEAAAVLRDQSDRVMLLAYERLCEMPPDDRPDIYRLLSLVRQWAKQAGVDQGAAEPPSHSDSNTGGEEQPPDRKSHREGGELPSTEREGGEPPPSGSSRRKELASDCVTYVHLLLDGKITHDQRIDYYHHLAHKYPGLKFERNEINLIKEVTKQRPQEPTHHEPDRKSAAAADTDNWEETEEL